MSPSVYRMTRINFAPRAGFSFAPTSIKNTVFRGGWVLGVNAMPAFTVGQITQAQADAITGPIQYLSEQYRSPYIEQYNFDVQHTFASKYLLDVAYIGNTSHH